MKDLQRYVQRLPMWLKVAFIAAIGYRLFKKVALQAKIKEVENQYKEASTTNPVTGVKFNSYALAVTLWHEFYDTVTEDETEIIRLFNTIPDNVAVRREVNNYYTAYLQKQKANPFDPWGILGMHYGKSLQEDAKYYLEAKYKNIETFFHSL